MLEHLSFFCVKREVLNSCQTPDLWHMCLGFVSAHVIHDRTSLKMNQHLTSSNLRFSCALCASGPRMRSEQAESQESFGFKRLEASGCSCKDDVRKEPPSSMGSKSLLISLDILRHSTQLMFP